MKRWAMLAGAMLAVGCFGNGGDAGAPDAAGGGANTPAEGSGGDTNTGSGDATGGNGAGTGGGQGDPMDPGDVDPYCPHAWNGFQNLDAFIEVTNALSSDSEISGAKIREDGELAVEYAEETGRHFGRAQEFVADEDVSSAFDDILHYQEMWMLPQAQLAAGATDLDDYLMKSYQLLLQDGVASAVSQGAVASGTISAYTLQRCSSTRWPE